MYLYVKLDWDAIFFFLVESTDLMNYALYEYRYMSARRGAQFVAIGMPTNCWKTFPPKTMKMLSTRNSSMLMMSSPVYLFLESECSLTKYGPLRPKTRNLYLRFPFLWIKEFRMIVVRLFCKEMIEKNFIPKGFDFKMSYLLEYKLGRFENWNTYWIRSLHHV